MKSDSAKKKRINITIDAELHELAAAQARSSHYTDFSGLITKLLRDDMRQPTPEPLPRSWRGRTTLTQETPSRRRF